MVPAMPALGRKGAGEESGAITTETVLVTPALLLLLMLIVHFAVWFHASHVAAAAAQEGARAARVEGGTEAAGRDKATAFLDALGREVIFDRQVVSRRGPASETARVEVSGYAAPVVPGMRLPVRAVSEGPVERFRAP